jgi:hypothetical protein
LVEVVEVVLVRKVNLALLVVGVVAEVVAVQPTYNLMQHH